MVDASQGRHPAGIPDCRDVRLALISLVNARRREGLVDPSTRVGIRHRRDDRGAVAHRGILRHGLHRRAVGLHSRVAPFETHTRVLRHLYCVRPHRLVPCCPLRGFVSRDSKFLPLLSR